MNLNRTRLLVAGAACITMTATALTVAHAVSAGNGAVHASASIVGTPSAGDPAPVVGVAMFNEDSTGVVHVNVKTWGLSAGLHGMHIHAIGACAPTFASAGGHFNPTGGRTRRAQPWRPRRPSRRRPPEPDRERCRARPCQYRLGPLHALGRCHQVVVRRRRQRDRHPRQRRRLHRRHGRNRTRQQRCTHRLWRDRRVVGTVRSRRPVGLRCDRPREILGAWVSPP